MRAINPRVFVFPIIGLSLSGEISAVATTNLLLETVNMLGNGGGDHVDTLLPPF